MKPVCIPFLRRPILLSLALCSLAAALPPAPARADEACPPRGSEFTEKPPAYNGRLPETFRRTVFFGTSQTTTFYEATKDDGTTECRGDFFYLTENFYLPAKLNNNGDSAGSLTSVTSTTDLKVKDAQPQVSGTSRAAIQTGGFGGIETVRGVDYPPGATNPGPNNLQLVSILDRPAPDVPATLVWQQFEPAAVFVGNQRFDGQFLAAGRDGSVLLLRFDPAVDETATVLRGRPDGSLSAVAAPNPNDLFLDLSGRAALNGAGQMALSWLKSAGEGDASTLTTDLFRYPADPVFPQTTPGAPVKVRLGKKALYAQDINEAGDIVGRFTVADRRPDVNGSEAEDRPFLLPAAAPKPIELTLAGGGGSVNAEATALNEVGQAVGHALVLTPTYIPPEEGGPLTVIQRSYGRALAWLRGPDSGENPGDLTDAFDINTVGQIAGSVPRGSILQSAGALVTRFGVSAPLAVSTPSWVTLKVKVACSLPQARGGGNLGKGVLVAYRVRYAPEGDVSLATVRDTVDFAVQLDERGNNTLAAAPTQKLKFLVPAGTPPGSVARLRLVGLQSVFNVRDEFGVTLSVNTVDLPISPYLLAGDGTVTITVN